MSSDSDASSEPDYRVWRAPRVGNAAAAEADAQASAEAQARERGYEAGLAEGRAAGQEEINARMERLTALLQALERPLDSVEEDTQRVLAELACSVAGQLVRREMSRDPDAIVPVVREAMETLQAESEAPEIRLHPEDAPLVREAFQTQCDEGNWRIVDDQTLSRGDCWVRAGHTSIDARLESRIRRVTDHVLGDDADAPPSGAASGDGPS
mgnify:CR=1 FL=1